MAVGTVTISVAGYGPAAIVTDLNDRDDTALTGKYKIRNYTISTPEPEITYHTPDFGDERIIRLEDGDRVAEFVMTIYGGRDRDVLDSNINELRRILKEATLHELDDAFPLFYLTTQPENASNATYHDIKAGWFDDSRSHWTAVSERNVIAYETVLYLILTPYGYRDAITLENFLPSSPHFLEDSDDDGLADGWNEVTDAATTTSLETTPALIGHQCQRVDTTSAASAQGIQSDTITCDAASFVNGFAWVSPLTGADPIKVQLIDGSGVVAATKTILVGDSTGVADYSQKDRVNTAITWYRVSIAGITTNANVALRIIRDTGDASAGASWYTDGCYLNVGLQTAPTDGWISSRVTDNNYDLESEARLNYCDVWGIPGDTDAVATWKLTAQSVGLGFFMGRMVDGKTRASEQIHWLDSADGTGTPIGNGVWSTNNNAAWSGDSAALFTEGATNNGGYLEWTLSGDEARDFARTPRNVIVLVQSSTVNLTMLLGVYGDSGNINFAAHNRAVSPAVASSPTLLNVGTINLAGVLPDNVPDTAEPDIVIRLTLGGLANGNTVHIDAVFMPPVKPEYMVYHITQGNGFGADELWIDGHNKQVVAEVRGWDGHFWKGDMWYLNSGQVMNRLVFMTFAHTSQFTYDLTAGFNWKLEVTPRGRHLLGSR